MHSPSWTRDAAMALPGGDVERARERLTRGKYGRTPAGDESDFVRDVLRTDAQLAVAHTLLAVQADVAALREQAGHLTGQLAGIRQELSGLAGAVGELAGVARAELAGLADAVRGLNTAVVPAAELMRQAASWPSCCRASSGGEAVARRAAEDAASALAELTRLDGKVASTLTWTGVLLGLVTAAVPLTGRLPGWVSAGLGVAMALLAAAAVLGLVVLWPRIGGRQVTGWVALARHATAADAQADLAAQRGAGYADAAANAHRLARLALAKNRLFIRALALLLGGVVVLAVTAIGGVAVVLGGAA